MKRGMTGKGRSGVPPLPRQRKALRVVQATLIALAGVAGKLGLDSWRMYDASGESFRLGAALVLPVLAGVFLGGAVWMGFRTVRGPRPPSL